MAFLKQSFDNGVFANPKYLPTYYRIHMRQQGELDLIVKNFKDRKEEKLPSTTVEELRLINISDQHYKLFSEIFSNMPPQLSVQIRIPFSILDKLFKERSIHTAINTLMDYCNGDGPSSLMNKEENDYLAILYTKEMWENLFNTFSSHPSAERFAKFLCTVADQSTEWPNES